MAGGGKRPGAGRPLGTKNKRTIAGETYARLIVEDASVRARMLSKAQEGTLEVELVKMLFAYAYGKPYEVPLDADSDTPRTITLQF